MSYKNGCCCLSSRGGLGQSPSEVDAARRILVGMIQRENARVEGYADTTAVVGIRRKIADAVTWARAAAWRQQAGELKDALESASVGIRLMHEASKAITSLSPADLRAEKAQEKTETGASFTDQVLQTLGLKTGVYQPAVAGGSIADVVGGAVGSAAKAAAASAPWLLPAVVGLGLIVLLRK